MVFVSLISLPEFPQTALSRVSTWMGDRLGIHDVVDILLKMWQGRESNLGSTPTKVLSGGANLPSVSVYGHITLNTPVLVQSLKLSNIGLS